MADKMARRKLARSAAGPVAVALLVVLTTGSAQAATVTVAAMNFQFSPATTAIAVGDTVRWSFAGEMHTVTSGTPGAPDGRFDSGFEEPGSSFEVRFTSAGTFRYFCQIHPEEMNGTILVRASATPKPTVASTPRPTARPSARATSRPTAAPTPTATASPVPAASPTPSATSSQAAQPSPSASATAGASQALLETPVPSTPPASPGPDAGAPTGAIDAAPITVLLVVLVVLLGGGLIVARGRRVA